MTELYGSIEAGGTKWVCAVGTGPHNIVAQTRIHTTSPADTLGKVTEFFASQPAAVAIGVASFGPLELRREHSQYGFITITPKPGWSNADVVGYLRDRLRVPVGFDTDVNGAALGEGRWGAAVGLETFVYLTVGTGIGGGAVVNGQVGRGLVHSEMGHLSVRRHADDTFAGRCPFHGDCLEGMASGPAIADRFGAPAPDLTGEEKDQAVTFEAHYLAEGLRTIIYTIAPQRCIIGGGVSHMDGLLPATRASLTDSLAGYPGLAEHAAEDFIVRPGLGDRSGIAGGFVLAERTLSA